MGARGPAAKPTALKVLEGNPGKQKLNKKEPKPKSMNKVPSPPKWLLPEAKKEWKRLAGPLTALGVLTEIDLSAFEALCQNYAYFMAVDAKILELGTDGTFAMQVASSGYISQHPILSLRNQYYNQWHRGLADFGLTPASRARIAIEDNMSASTGRNGEDDMECLLSGRW